MNKISHFIRLHVYILSSGILFLTYLVQVHTYLARFEQYFADIIAFWCSNLRGMYKLSGDVTLSKLFLSPSELGSTL